MAYDILIKSGSVIDGVGNPPAIADISIKNNKISAIGNLANSNANLIINANSKYVTPGFIDITNHSDTHLTLFHYPNFESLIMQGITTIIGGNCGASLAPLGSRDAIQAIRKWADPAEINIDWAGVGEFLKNVEQRQPTVNFGTFIGYGTLRRGVIGDAVRLLNLEEREKVKLLLREGIKEGAFGLSLGLAYGHEKISTTEEVIEIAKVLQETGGIIKIHLRSEGLELLASVNEAVRIGREIGVPIQISHLKTIGKKAWSSFEKALGLIENARASGADINFDVSPYHTTGSALYLLIPAWAREGGFNELFKKLDNLEERKKIIKALKSYTLHYNRILVTSAKTKTIVGHTLAEIAEEGNSSNEEALLETIRANEGRVSIVGRTVSAKNITLALKNKNSFVSSDGVGFSQEASRLGNLVHPRSFGAFPHFWHKFVTDTKFLQPHVALQKMTSGPAGKVGLKKRGVLAKGNYADIIIFDPRLMRDRATYRNPFRYAAGIEWVIINGKIVVEKGRFLGVRAGNVLQKM